jgi:lipopolysaccharide assembly protein A
MIRLILVGVLLLLSLAFFLQNQEQEVTLWYFFGLFEASTPIYKPILAGFGMGLLVSGILLFPPWIRVGSTFAERPRHCRKLRWT